MSATPSIEISAGKQSGTVLLALMLIILAAASYALIKDLNDAVHIFNRNDQGMAALQEAKQALIGYALRYPEYKNGEYGPGYLPCPDTDDDGSAQSSCAIATGSYIGRIPWKTLEIDNLMELTPIIMWLSA